MAQSDDHHPPRFVSALKSAALAALVAFGLFSLIIGIRTDQGSTGALVIWTRFDDLTVFVVVVFIGVFLRDLVLGDRTVRIKAAMPGAITAVGATLRPFVAPALLAFAVLVPVLFYSNRYILDLGILVLTYVMLGWGLNIVVGLAGLLDLGYVAFYAVGAYSYALLAQNFHWSFWICLPLAGILASFWGILLGFPVLRLRGDYLAIVTLAFGEIIRLVLLNWQSFTGGPNGIPSIPRPSFFGLPFIDGEGSFAEFFGLEYDPTHRVVFMFYLILALALITNWVTIRLRRLPIGRAWEALREDEIACRSLGINTTNTKLTAFAMGALFAGFAGSFFATRQGFISPESFVFMESALVLAIVVLGGMGSQLGVAIAALTMIGGFELFRQFAEYRMLLFGLAMVLIMAWRPRGLIGTRTPSVYLEKEKPVPAELRTEGQG
ncbi:MAG TPA: high-affinity branched-chain amino acid ABC transporter permease LivM [Pseudolabrys sp.]|nr:high-affinity branched-chain amino acid ABC transporter permease LivM [Pseudolabrys sp.]